MTLNHWSIATVTIKTCHRHRAIYRRSGTRRMRDQPNR
ncbi:hypothetical protein J3P88_01305 [Pseudomonas sp. Z3-6]|uniref:Uncharacterized protein n=1 Tax=Pseudomonas zanjanensis TaxID=2745496 RepID=A0A923JKP1_9PSED|nr:hypothetical protein [Pseudomonas sp. SWRI179]